MSQRTYSDTHRQAQRPPHTRRLWVEALEDRRLLAVVTVDTELDEVKFNDGVTSLREAIFATNTVPGADEIVFDFGHDGPATILLEHGELEITDELSITGDGPDLLTIDAQQQSRIFNITAETGDFTIDGMTLTGGRMVGDNAGWPSQDNTYSGGAIRSLTTGSLTIQNSAVSDSSTAGDRTKGGGIFTDGNVTVTSSTISGNSASGIFGNGGGISGNNVNVTSSTISGNSAFGEGGGISGGNVTVTSSTITGNSAKYGGGINGSNVTVTSSTISGNSAHRSGRFVGKGGGIWGGDVTVTSSTITDNQARNGGGGIWTDSDDSTAVLSHTIVAGNSRVAEGNPPVADDLVGNGTFELGYSLVGTAVGAINTTPGTINYFGVDPLLGPLQDNGGATWTHALLQGSPAIDAGDPLAMASVGDVPEFDQRGEPYVRVADGDGDGTARIDIGAFEVPDTFVVDTLVDESDGDFSQEDFSLREAVEQANAAIGPNNIEFDQELFSSPQTMLLNMGELEITELLTVDGPGKDLLTIDAQQNSRIFNITAEIGDFKIDGMTLTGGKSTGDGGAIRSLTLGSLTIEDSDVTDSSTVGRLADGGGVYAEGDVTVIGSTISYNSASFGGGGIWTIGTMTITGSTIIGNQSFHDGGGVYAQGETTVTNSTFTNNRSTSYSGGGLFAIDTMLEITGSTFSNNTGFRDGGGLFTLNTTTTISDSTIAGNSAASLNGGGIWASGTLSIAETSLAGNSGISGGGIFAIDATTTITGSKIDGNSARVGGGIWASGGTLDASVTSIINNTAIGGDADGGGIFANGVNLHIESSTVEANSVSSTFQSEGGGISMHGGMGTIVDSSITGNQALGGVGDGGGLYGTRAALEIQNSNITGNYASRDGGGVEWISGRLTLVP